ASNGFANRFIWIAVRRSKLLPHGGRLTTEALQPHIVRLAEALAFARRPGPMARTTAANRGWEGAYPILTRGRPGLLGAVAGRAEAQALRLSMLYALLDRSAMIEVEHLVAALALWDYAERSIGYVFGDSLGDRDLDKLMAALMTATEGLTREKIRSEV